MKKRFPTKPFFLLLISVMIFYSCNKKRVPKDVIKLIPLEYLEELKEAGFNAYLGDKPPVVEGIYEFKPINVYDNSERFSVGATAVVTYFKFENQVGNSLDVLIKNWVETGEVEFSEATIIRGDDNKFTIIAQVENELDGKKYVYDYVLSGEISTNGIENIQMGFVMVENEDAQAAPKGTIRLFNNQFSRKVTYF